MSKREFHLIHFFRSIFSKDSSKSISFSNGKKLLNKNTKLLFFILFIFYLFDRTKKSAKYFLNKFLFRERKFQVMRFVKKDICLFVENEIKFMFNSHNNVFIGFFIKKTLNIGGESIYCSKFIDMWKYFFFRKRNWECSEDKSIIRRRKIKGEVQRAMNYDF